MRITRVTFSFFAIGFLAGSFEQAAGLGYSEPGQHLATHAVALTSLTAASAADLAAAPVGHSPPATGGSAAEAEAVSTAAGGPAELDGQAKSLPAAPPASSDAVAALSPPPTAQAESTAPAPKLRSFLDPLLQMEDEALVVPEPQIAERPQEFIMPFEKGRVTSMFNQGRRHPAIDLAGPLGTTVYATTRKQRVTFAGRRGGYGNLVITRDPQGRQHYYGHLHRITARVGRMLDQGETLGLLGSTGRSTGPHVHYEVRTRAGRHLDPSKLLFAGRGVSRGYAWNTPRPESTSVAARSDQPRPR